MSTTLPQITLHRLADYVWLHPDGEEAVHVWFSAEGSVEVRINRRTTCVESVREFPAGSEVDACYRAMAQRRKP